MFRSKKGANPDTEPVSESVAATEVAAPPPEVAKPEPRRNIPFPAGRPLPHTAFPLDISRRSSELSQMAAGRGGEPAPAGAARDKTMTIGREVEVRGEVAVCDRLVIDGSAQLTVNGARLLQIGACGVFTGNADVTEADIGGRFDGELSVRERLTIRATGEVRGRIRYGQIVIEAGGELSGDVGTLDAEGRGSATGEAASGDVSASHLPFADVKLAAPAD